MNLINNAPMSKYTSFRCGGNARRLFICDDVSELTEVMNQITNEGEKYVFLGNGSNTLFPDEGYDGTVVSLGKAFSEIKLCDEDENNISLKCMSGALLSKVSKVAMDAGLCGLEFASGIPGSIGGAVFMNAGAYGGEMKDVLESVELLYCGDDGAWSLKKVHAGELELGYRQSKLQETGEIVVSATLKLAKGNKEEIIAKISELTKKRTEKQPLEFPSAGSFFKRPEGYFAAKLIEDAGLKGLTVGGAQVSSKHCGFVINKGDASAEDIINLMNLIQNTVFDKFGVHLEPEVRIIGL